MKSFFLTYWYPHRQNPHFCVFVHEHALALAEAGLEVKVLALSFIDEGIWYDKKVVISKPKPNLEIHHITYSSRWHKLVYANPFHLFFLAKNYYNRHFPSFNPDIVHSNVVFPCSVVGRMFSLWLKKPHVITEHWTKINRFMAKHPLAFLGKKAFATCDALTVVSQYSKKNISLYANADRIHVVANVVDAGIFAFKPKKPIEETVNLLYVGYFIWPKLPMVIVEAIALVQNQTHKKVKLYMIGKGPQEADIRQKIETDQLPIEILGSKTKPEIAQWMQQVDFYIHAAEIETFSVVTAEALCTGTPCIVSDCTALPELVSEENGVLCQNNPESFANGILKAMETNYDHTAISAKTHHRFSYKKIGDDFRKVYEVVLQKKS